MRTKQEIEAKIKEVENIYNHVLIGSLATIQTNTPRALQQLEAEAILLALHWILGTKYKSKLKGVDK